MVRPAVADKEHGVQLFRAGNCSELRPQPATLTNVDLTGALDSPRHILSSANLSALRRREDLGVAYHNDTDSDVAIRKNFRIEP